MITRADDHLFNDHLHPFHFNIGETGGAPPGGLLHASYTTDVKPRPILTGATVQGEHRCFYPARSVNY
jgi:hypothetical protein